ncbi:streptophobe family protein [Streptomyces sp. bgisy154]|uniref:streptophobe family protein n=1 Tax=Streptomyces sp. bgisy154 TaxID=3413794 RepID=UPI003D71D6C3
MSGGTGVGASGGTGVEGPGRAEFDEGVPWGDVLLSAVAAVSWALIGMAATAALGLHLLEADTAGSLGPMTAAVVALGAGGSVSPSGDVSAFGLTGAEATTAVEITPLGVSLVGALLLSWFFLRSLRTARVVVAPAEHLARAGAVVAVFVATLGGLAWAGHDVITLDGGSLGVDDLPGTGGGGGIEIPGLGDIGDIGGLLPDRVGDLIDARAGVGFSVDTVPTLLGGLGWSAGVLLIALLASRRTPLPPGWEAVHRVVRPAVSALTAVFLVAVAAGIAAAAYAAAGDDHPKRIAGAALLGAPNGVWLGLGLGLFVPWDGRATGVLTRVLPDPLDELLGTGGRQNVTLGRLAELDDRVWLLGAAAALAALLAGVLTAVRTPVPSGGTPGPGLPAFAGRCALRLGIATAVALPLSAWLTEVSVDASLAVLGVDAFGAGVELHGRLGAALLLGALWGAGAGAVGAGLAWACGAAGTRVAAAARGDVVVGGAGGVGGVGGEAGGVRDVGGGAGRARGAGAGGPGSGEPGVGSGGGPGPYTPSAPYRPPNPATNPYLRVPEEVRQPEDERPSAERREVERPGAERPGADRPGDDVYGAPTMARPIEPPPRRPGTRPSSGGRPSSGARASSQEWPPPPPPPPPPAPPRRPKR